MKLQETYRYINQLLSKKDFSGKVLYKNTWPTKTT